MWQLDYQEGWAPKNWGFWILVLEKTLDSPLDCKEVKPVHPKGNHSWIIHWKDWCWSWSSNTLATWCVEPTHWKRLWCWERLKAGGEGVAEDEMVGWHHWLNGHEYEQTSWDSEERGAWHAAVHEVAKSQTLSDWKATIYITYMNPKNTTN